MHLVLAGVNDDSEPESRGALQLFGDDRLCGVLVKTKALLSSCKSFNPTNHGSDN